MISLRKKTRKERFAHYDRKEKVFFNGRKKSNISKTVWLLSLKEGGKEGVCRPRLDPFFFYNVPNRQVGRIKMLFAYRKLIYKRFCMKKGFTLIELLVVVLIIGILSAYRAYEL